MALIYFDLPGQRAAMNRQTRGGAFIYLEYDWDLRYKSNKFKYVKILPESQLNPETSVLIAGFYSNLLKEFSSRKHEISEARNFSCLLFMFSFFRAFVIDLFLLDPISSDEESVLLKLLMKYWSEER